MKTVITARMTLLAAACAAGRMIEMLKKSGEWKRYAARDRNPEGKPEVSIGLLSSARDWTAARQLVAEGVFVVVAGSLDAGSDHAYLVAGHNFPMGEIR